MFKLESYVTPYIFAYLGKYFKNFDPSDFQMSVWGGGAVFQNLNLDLQVLDQEFSLPVTFVSGHIHELKIAIPWTKVTSEPIILNINTIEITLKLKSLEDERDGRAEESRAPLGATRKMNMEEGSTESPPPGYMHNLISKILTNVHVNFENVIVKYVEEDIVLSLNIKRACYSTADQNWNSAFVDLIAPDFELRKKFEFSDLTICLDKSNTAGKIETYQEPLLYKCSFGVRILQQFRSSFLKIAHFTRMDFLLDEMDFSITDEQVPMMMRLYNLIRSLFEVNLKTVALNPQTSDNKLREREETVVELEGEDEGDEGSLMDWGSWAVSWLPPISSVLGEEGEGGQGGEELEEEEPPSLIAHYGFYVNELRVRFKALERMGDKGPFGRAMKVNFLPFLNCSFQGIAADFVLRGDEANYVLGISSIVVDPLGFCPCGIVDGIRPSLSAVAPYIRVGRSSQDFASNSMFSDSIDGSFPTFNYDFQFDGHVEVFSEEMMLERTPAFAVEYLQTRKSPTTGGASKDEDTNYFEKGSKEIIDLARDKLLTRVVLAPCSVTVCSGLVHRLRMINFAVESYNYEPYGEINRLMRRRQKEKTSDLLELSRYGNFESAYDIYQFTILRPQVEVWAADHPEYSYESREKHLDQKRRIKAGAPFSHFVPNWPKLLFTAACIDGKLLDPNLKFKSLVLRASAEGNPLLLSPQMIQPFTSSMETKIYQFEASLMSGAYNVGVCSQCTLTYMKKQHLQPELKPEDLVHVSEKHISSDIISVECSWAQVLLVQAIVVSMIQNKERFSEHLLTSSLLYDLPGEKRSRLIVQMKELSWTSVVSGSAISQRFRLGGCRIELEQPGISDTLLIFIAPSIRQENQEKGWGRILLQRPVESVEASLVSNHLFIVKLGEWKMYCYKEILSWIQYHPAPIQCIIPPSARTQNEVKVPLRPSSHEGSSSRKSTTGQTVSSFEGPTKTALDALSSELLDKISVGDEPDSKGRVGSRGSLPDSHGGSSRSFRSSAPAYHLPPRKDPYSTSEAQDSTSLPFELYLLSHLNRIKSTFLYLEMEEAEVLFPLRQSSHSQHVFLRLPKIHSQPQSFKSYASFDQDLLPLQLDKEYFDGELFPHRMSLENMYFGTVEEGVGIEMASVPLSIEITLSLTTKETESGSVVTTACIHTDITLVEINLSYSQVELLIGLAEEFFHNSNLFSNLSFLLPPIRTNEAKDETEGDKLISDIKSEFSSLIQTKSNFEKTLPHQLTTSYEGSIPGSGSEWTSPDSGNNVTCDDSKKVTCWVQMTVGVFRFSISSPSHKAESQEKLVFEVEDIVSSLDIQSVFIKWSHKLSNIRLQNFEINPLTKDWVRGKTLGILFSSGDEITREIQVLSSSFNFPDNQESHISMPTNISARYEGTVPNHQKMRGSITMTFTRVQSLNFHEKAGVPSPISKWNAAVYKFAEKDYNCYAPYDGENLRSLSEIDLQIKAMDLVFNPLVLIPYSGLIERILALLNRIKGGGGAPKDPQMCQVPACNNNTLPLIYLSTGAIRIFLKSNPVKEISKSKTPDFILFECSAITVVSQTENALNRTVVTPILFQMAEKARILGVPGSPVEDRQYQIDFQGITISTGVWADINDKSLGWNLRSSALLKTQGENPALEWNIRTVEMGVNDVKTYPFLCRMEFSVGLAPAIVYDRSWRDTCKSYIVAGHALELNVMSDINLTLNLQQLNLMKEFYSQTSDLLLGLANSTKESDGISTVLNYPNNLSLLEDSEDKTEESRSSSRGEFDSGIHSLAHLPPYPQKLSFRLGEVSKTPSPPHRHRQDMVPLDALVTSGMTTITLYDLHLKSETDEVEGAVPLAFVTITQPHFLLSLSQRSQKAEVSLFELTFKLGSSAPDRVRERTCWIPGTDQFDNKIFDSIQGERDVKTGMVSPFFTFKITDFLNPACGVVFDIRRPIKTTLSQDRVNNMLSLYRQLRGKSLEELETVTSVDDWGRKILGRISNVNCRVQQFVFLMSEGGAEIAVAFTEANLAVRIQNGGPKAIQAQTIAADFFVKAASMTSKINNRSSIILSPFNVNGHGDCCWKSWLEHPMVIVRITSDPLAIHIGPQNLLAILQVLHVLGSYLTEDGGNPEAPVQVDGTEGLENPESKIICDSYEDDLRAGTFKYVRVNSSAELPQVYQIGFCESERTMTWRYPQHRVLSSIHACPIPIDNHPPSPLRLNKLECKVEYWDDAMEEFLFYGAFTLSEQEGTNVGTPSRDKLHSYISTLWRIKIETSLEESDSKHVIRPEILAACLKVNSIHDSSLVPKLKAFFQVPRISLNFINNFFFAGRGENPVVAQYSNHSLKHFDQNFASITFEMTSLLLTSWMNQLSVEHNSYVNMDTLDYEYLTLSRVLEPVLFKSSLTLYELDSSTSSNSELDIISKNITVRVGASVLHTLLASLESWTQVLGGWTGSEISLEGLSALPSVNLHQILILNTLREQIRILQSGSEEGTEISGEKCGPFYWPTQKAKPICKLGLKDKDWAYSSDFSLTKAGYLVRLVHKRPLFIHLAGIGGTQKLVTVTGSLLIGNALDENLEVAILLRDSSSELNWKIPSRRHGPSQLIDLLETEHVRFRIGGKRGGCNPWSSVVTPTDLNNSKSHSIPVPLFVETEGVLTTFSVWCTLVQETVQEFPRYLIVLSPFYRVRSFLPSETMVHISTAKHGNKENYKLKGQGCEMQIDFTGSHEVTNHLTFQSNPLGSASTPSIPLLPDGPTLEMTHVQRSIDEILTAINGIRFADSIHKEEVKEEVWPFISDTLPKNEEWVRCEQPETELEVEFAPWIPGIPTVLLDVRPWALIINLCGADLLFSLCPEGEDETGTTGWVHHTVPNKSVLSPSRISLQRGQIKLGLCCDGAPVLSSKLRFSEEIYRTDVHHSNVDNLIPIDAFSRLDLPFRQQIGHLSMETRVKKKVIILTVKPTFFVANCTREDFCVGGLWTPRNGRRESNRNSNFQKLSARGDGEDEGNAEPLLWFSGGEEEEEYSSHKSSIKHLVLSCGGGPSWFIQLIDFSIVFNNMNSSQGVPAAALSVSVPTARLASAQLQAEAEPGGGSCEEVTIPIIVSWTSMNGLVWISLSPDPSPQVILHNQTAMPFVYVQSAGPGIPFLELDYFQQYSILPPNSVAHFTFPQKYAAFPELSSERKPLPLLLFSKLPKDLNEETGNRLVFDGHGLSWSNELNLDGDASQYLCIRDFVEGKVRVQKLGFTYYLYIENMSNVEVSAKDVRRRIGSEGSGRVGSEKPTLHLQTPPPDPAQELVQVQNRARELDSKSQVSRRRRSGWLFRCFLSRFSLIVTEDFLSSTERRELVSLVLEDCFCETIPQAEKQQENMSLQSWLLNLQVGDVQLDSPGFPFERTCDFPVVLKQETEYKKLTDKQSSDVANFFNQICSEKRNSSPMISLTVSYRQNSRGDREMERIHVASEPFCLNIEDRLVDFVLSSLQETVKIVEARLSNIRAASVANKTKEEFGDALEEWEDDGRIADVRIKIPEEAINILSNFSHPIRIEEFRIEGLEICLTLRIARLVYLAVDHSRLKISEFEAIGVLSTSYRFGQTLSAHYTTGAIFQVGNPVRLIGSLELLGSPSSLAQSVGSGLKDFVLYPYQGIFQGPTGFLGGLGNGVTSLVKSITSGTLTSVTNWAWSVSRNLDKLTLDEEEQILTEAARRVQVHGFRDGLVQGLTGFGIRLLGAVGGIAHHPIQNVIQHGGSASSFITGMSKGMIGVVTRPIGGIVQLVAMTGEGVLRGAGWTPHLKTKEEGGTVDVWSCGSSILKYEMKMENSESILLLVDAVQLFQNGHLQPLSLLISTQNLYLIDISEQVLMSHFPLSLVRMEMNEDRNMICLRIAPSIKKDDMSFAKERIMDFVRGNSLPQICESVGEGVFEDGGCEGDKWAPLEENVWRSGSLRSPEPLSTSSTAMWTAISGSGKSVASSATSPTGHPLEWSREVSGGGTLGPDGPGGKIGDFLVTPHDKAQFGTTLSWAKLNEDDKYFSV